ncbi:uncharacterized protein LOC127848585 isoform X3 [Dreissena polymorpha]|uniref:uncharacterized protein LOC127848585 isoform X3 n=1 Tax=Dreissena polymorpha TaxID=45954 RepID=UPI0022650969|nr:uncharacterized protein LOC127848585 isoform X3 [Dreissena polymorpha]
MKNLNRLREMATNAASSTITSVSGTEAQISDNGGKCVKPPFKIKIEVKEGNSVTFAMEQFGQLQTVSLSHGNGEFTFTQTQVPWTHEKSELPFSHTQVKSEKPDTEIVGAGNPDIDVKVVSATMQG